MHIEDLIAFCNPLSVWGDLPETTGSLCQDSRTVKPGDIFIAVKGTQTDGHKFVDNALKQGAAILIVEQEMVSPQKNVTVLQVEDTRALLAPLAQKLAGNPAKALQIIGITGTNGKTTVATLVWQVLRKLNERAALLGTVSKKINDRDYPSTLTTADPIEIASDMKQMVEAGCKTLVMEVSSHALHQQRVYGLPFHIAAFTNLSLDHLDYHKSMEEYASAKKTLFDGLSETSRAVINSDDPYGKKMVSDTKASVVRFSLHSEAMEAVQVNVRNVSAGGIVMDVGDTPISSPLIGMFNAYNVAQAFLICTLLGFDKEDVAKAIAECRGAEGRMEKVSPSPPAQNAPIVIVDYSHTPDSLQNAAATLARLKEKDQKMIIVFGCGGDRDKTKRPVMANVAETWGDHVIVTSDNPRTEDPNEIIKEIAAGFSPEFTPRLIPSREEAIRTAVLESDASSIVLIAGKGHETYQEIHGKRIHFDDREIARSALSERNNHSNPKPEEVS